MESEIYKVILKVQEYCRKRENCSGCELQCTDEYDEDVCSINGIPEDWITSQLSSDVLWNE